MNLSEIFIRRPVATSLIMVALFVVGLLAYRELPVSALPQVDYPTIVVSSSLPGGSPDTIATAVTTPLERQLGQIPSLTQMTSVSSLGISQITLQFSLDRNIDAAEQDVQAAINAASNILPRTLPTPPTYSKSNPADAPVLTLSASSDKIPLNQVIDLADSILAQKISQVSGVGLVSLCGGQRPAVRLQVDPVALAALGLGLEDIRATIAQANVNQPKGTLDGGHQAFTLATDDQLATASAYKPLIIAYKNGAPVRLVDIADVVDGIENAHLAGWANGKRAIILNVQRQPGANIIEVAERVKALLPKLEASLPKGVDVEILSDRTQSVRASVDDVELTLVLTVILVVLVMYAFLRSIRATLIPSITVPLSLFGTFGVMYLVGYSLDNLSLMALTISTGFVVDDAIVMIENIARYVEEGEVPALAALKGARQIGFTIISLTLSLIAVLIPLLFMGGVIGRLFREFAVTLALAIGVSAALSLSLTPLMCAELLGRDDDSAQGALHRLLERSFDALLARYKSSLDWVLAHQPETLAATLGTVALTAFLAYLVPKGFFPEQDTGVIEGTTESAPDVAFPIMMEKQRAITDVLLGDPAVESVASFVGADGTNLTSNSGRLTITLKPRSARKASASEVIRRLEPKLADLGGVTAFLRPAQDLQIDSRVSRTQYQYVLQGTSADELRSWASRTYDSLKKVPQLREVAMDLVNGGIEASLTIDRDTASRLGVRPQAIDDTLYDAFGQRQISTIFTQLNQYRVIMEVKPEFMKDPTALQHIFVTSDRGSQVPLSAFTRLQPKSAPLAVNHQAQFPSVTISFDLAAGVSLGDAVDAVRTASAQIEAPPGGQADFQGSAAAFRKSLATEPFLLLAALLTVYVVLGVLYESYIHPVTILSTLPSAGAGALLALILTHEEFSIIALIGVILLIGIVKKNAIMMIDFALDAERESGMSPYAAIRQACLLRFRPIMMTTMAALLGGLPLALGTGTGSELRRPLGISIVGGLILSQVLTLYTTPVIYLYLDRLSRWLKGDDSGARAIVARGR
jgi:multidrug efflux pump